MANGVANEAVDPEVAEMLAELEGRDSASGAESGFPSTFQAEGGKTSSRFPAGFAASGMKDAPTPRWPIGFVMSGGKDAQPARWPGRFVASGTKFVR